MEFDLRAFYAQQGLSAAQILDTSLRNLRLLLLSFLKGKTVETDGVERNEQAKMRCVWSGCLAPDAAAIIDAYIESSIAIIVFFANVYNYVLPFETAHCADERKEIVFVKFLKPLAPAQAPAFASSDNRSSVAKELSFFTLLRTHNQPSACL